MVTMAQTLIDAVNAKKERLYQQTKGMKGGKKSEVIHKKVGETRVVINNDDLTEYVPVQTVFQRARNILNLSALIKKHPWLEEHRRRGVPDLDSSEELEEMEA